MKKCYSCGKEDGTVKERECAFVREVHDKVKIEVICDDCEREHFMDI